MNWMPIKHTLFVNRTKAGTFSLILTPCDCRMKGGFRCHAESPDFHEALSEIENKVKAIKIIREGA